MKEDVVDRLKEFMENEARSCSMDFGCITPLYVYRMWGKSFRLRESIMNSMNYKVGIFESITKKTTTFTKNISRISRSRVREFKGSRWPSGGINFSQMGE